MKNRIIYDNRGILVMEKNSHNRHRFNAIDLCKLLMSFCVVAIHTGPLVGYTNKWGHSLYYSFVEMAVPFFFLSSGFLLASRIDGSLNTEYAIKKIMQYTLKIFKMYMLWSVIYLPLAVNAYISAEMGLCESIKSYVKKLIFVGEHHNSWMLWYLLSTIYALISVVFMLKYMRMKIEKIIVVGIFFFILGLGINFLMRYNGAMPIVMLAIRSFISETIVNGRIFSGLFYIPIGMFFAKYKGDNKKGMILVVWLMTFILNVVILGNTISSILTAISSICFFLIIKDLRFKDAKIYPFFRKMSTVIYFIHLYVWTLYYTVVYGETRYGLDSFIITLISCVTISIIYTILRMRIESKQ